MPLFDTFRMHLNDRATRRNGTPKTTASKLALYQCKAIYEGSADRFELTLNKNDTVKVLDKKDHGELAAVVTRVSYCGETSEEGEFCLQILWSLGLLHSICV